MDVAYFHSTCQAFAAPDPIPFLIIVKHKADEMDHPLYLFYYQSHVRSRRHLYDPSLYEITTLESSLQMAGEAFTVKVETVLTPVLSQVFFQRFTLVMNISCVAIRHTY